MYSLENDDATILKMEDWGKKSVPIRREGYTSESGDEGQSKTRPF